MMKYLGYFFTRLLAELFRLIPFWLLLRLSDGLAFLLFHLGYRRAVVFDGLRRCFPEKNETEIHALARRTYRNLADVTLESLKGITMSFPALHRRYRPVNPEVVNDWLASGRSIILAGSHCNNWEWGVIMIAGWLRGQTIGVYKPMSNKLVERWSNARRGRYGLILKSTKEAFASVEQFRGDPVIFLMLADQSPSNRKRAHWTYFFGRPTAWLHGVDEIARRNNYPVVYYEVLRVRRGFYEIVFSKLIDEPAAVAPGAVTVRYAQKLESQIRRQPEDWLWSHKRWKMQPDGTEEYLPSTA